MANNQDDAISQVHFFGSEQTFNACPPLEHAGPPASQFFQRHSGGERQQYKDSDCVMDADGRLWIMLNGAWELANRMSNDPLNIKQTKALKPAVDVCPPLQHAGPPQSKFFQWSPCGETERYRDAHCVQDSDGRAWIMVRGAWVEFSWMNWESVCAWKTW